jgi:putative phage-type endonuclease
MKQTHTLIQGSPEWAEHRSKYFNASDAASAAGISKYKSRAKLLREKATGFTQEYDSATLARFAKGHEYEAIARPWAEEIIGEELYPAVMSDEIDGLPLSASFDGIDLMEQVTFEHKSANATLIAALESGVIPDEYKPQLEQGLLISGASRCLFMASSGDKDAMRYAWYESDLTVRKGLLAAWKQFSADLANYSAQDVEQEVTAAPVAGFGSLVMQVEGRVVACNIDAFQVGAQAFLDRLPKAAELQSDQDFADAESAVKACSEAESRIQSALDSAMAQAASIDEVFRAARHVSELIRSARLALDKSVKGRKESIREEIVGAARLALVDHVTRLNTRLEMPYMPSIMGDFAAVIKGKKTVQSIRDACDTELARCKIMANEIADKIEINQRTLREMAGEHKTLFPDSASLMLKANDDLQAVIRLRIADHLAAIKAADEAKAEAERKAQAAACIANEAPNIQPVATSIPAEAPNIAQVAPNIEDGARIKLGDINLRLSPLAVTADMLAALGFQPAGKEGAAKLYRQADYQSICAAIVRHVQTAALNHHLRKAT